MHKLLLSILLYATLTQAGQAASLKQKIISLWPSWFHHSYFYLTYGQWLGLFGLLLIGYFSDRIIRLFVGRKILSLLNRKRTIIDQSTGQNYSLPFGLMVFSGTWLLGLQFFSLPQTAMDLCWRAGIVIFTIGCVWALHRIVDILSVYFQELAYQGENKFDDLLIPLIRKSAKVLVLCIGALFVAQSLTLNVTNILAGLGLGGLAFALAAKDTLSNLFGSLTVLLDRPFQIGDWVQIGGDIEGTVEEVGIRSTRIRTFYDSVISVPNNKLTNTHIDNYGCRRYRRFTTKIGLQYDTPPQLIQEFCQAVREKLQQHPHIRQDSFYVHLNEMADSSLQVLLYLFWQVPDWGQELQEKERLLLEILQLGERIGVVFAFPTQTLHVIQENPGVRTTFPSS